MYSQRQSNDTPDSVVNDATTNNNKRLKYENNNSTSEEFLLKSDVNIASKKDRLLVLNNELKKHGYLLLKQAIPLELCKEACGLIEEDMGEEGRKKKCLPAHQEEPIENLNPATRKCLQTIQQYVVEEIFKKQLGWKNTKVPKEWDQTLYGRVKNVNNLTPFHCDAFNTIIQRNFVATETETIKKFKSSKYSLNNSTSDAYEGMKLFPIYTFWIPLVEIASPNTSHLRIHIGSHTLPNIQFKAKESAVEPADYRYQAKNFKGPREGYEIGDVVIFHCLTQHEGSVQKKAKKKSTNSDNDGSKRRISMDGRVYSEDINQYLITNF